MLEQKLPAVTVKDVGESEKPPPNWVWQSQFNIPGINSCILYSGAIQLRNDFTGNSSFAFE